LFTALNSTLHKLNV